MKVFALVTARSGSKGVPDKNIKHIGGHTLLEWSIKSSLRTQSVTQVYLSTDSEDYANIGKECGAIIPFLRPKELASDTANDLDVIKHFLSAIDVKPDALIHVRPTTPLRDPLILDKAIDMFFIKKGELTSLRSIHEMSESAYKSFEVNEKGFLTTIGSIESGDKANLPRQAFPKTYVANGYVDVLDPNYILKRNKLHGDKILAFQTPVVTEVDSIEDLEYLEWQITKQPQLLKTVFGDK
ncbi:MAG: acylneuraminate cytidylyltransferase family protein [Actinomycetota bacterium]|nr:acylneuraminate cytidylyltransferase family protein [Actinomycetota bacterium]